MLQQRLYIYLDMHVVLKTAVGEAGLVSCGSGSGRSQHIASECISTACYAEVAAAEAPAAGHTAAHLQWLQQSLLTKLRLQAVNSNPIYSTRHAAAAAPAVEVL
jgi:hypothetical protein